MHMNIVNNSFYIVLTPSLRQVSREHSEPDKYVFLFSFFELDSPLVQTASVAAVHHPQDLRGLWVNCMDWSLRM
jgi:hypothetical protein